MRKVFGYILLGFIVLIGIVLGIAAFQPKEVHYERSITTTASSEAIFALLNDFKRLKDWSPFVKADPDIKMTFGPVTEGQGAEYGWESAMMGKGRMQIVTSMPFQRIDMDLEFIEPFPSKAKAYYVIMDEGGVRRVTWGMDGTNDSIVQRAGYMFFDADAVIGAEFEKGLHVIKEIVEGRQ